ncbi:MAG: hypothetical protein ABI360_03215 [Allobranchiibius sp.]
MPCHRFVAEIVCASKLPVTGMCRRVCHVVTSDPDDPDRIVVTEQLLLVAADAGPTPVTATARVAADAKKDIAIWREFKGDLPGSKAQLLNPSAEVTWD